MQKKNGDQGTTEDSNEEVRADSRSGKNQREDLENVYFSADTHVRMVKMNPIFH